MEIGYTTSPFLLKMGLHTPPIAFFLHSLLSTIPEERILDPIRAELPRVSVRGDDRGDDGARGSCLGDDRRVGLLVEFGRVVVRV